MAAYDPLGDDPPPSLPATTARDLALAGYTHEEIARATGRTVESVSNDPAATVPLGPAHIARLEYALFTRGVGGTTWEERLDKLGEVRRVEAQVLPDVKAAATILERRAPERWQAGRQEQLNVVVVRIDGKEGARVTLQAQREAIEGEIVDPPPPTPLIF